MSDHEYKYLSVCLTTATVSGCWRTSTQCRTERCYGHRHRPATSLSHSSHHYWLATMGNQGAGGGHWVSTLLCQLIFTNFMGTCWLAFEINKNIFLNCCWNISHLITSHSAHYWAALTVRAIPLMMILKCFKVTKILLKPFRSSTCVLGIIDFQDSSPFPIISCLCTETNYYLFRLVMNSQVRS